MTTPTATYKTVQSSPIRQMVRRALTFLSNPELVYYFIALRVARLYTRMAPGRIKLSTRTMRAAGLGRYVQNGEVFYTYRGASYPESIALGRAMGHIKNVALTYCSGRGLDIGANRWPLPGAHPVDNLPDENAYRLDRWPDNSLDFIFSSHCLEHLSEWHNALALWTSKIKPGGVLFLYLPHKSMTLWEPGSPWVGNDHVWSPTVEAIVPVLEKHGMRIIAVDPGPDGYFSFYIAARNKSGGEAN